METVTSRPASLPDTGFVREKALLQFIPISRASLWARAKQGTFPRPVKLSANVTAWRVEDVRAWMAAQSA